MSRYTTEFRYLFDNYSDDALGLADYPIYDESYRERLNQLIKNTYAFDEIGFETPARFCWYLKNKMRLIMPYYNNIYRALTENINPFINTKIITSGHSYYEDSGENQGDNTSKDTDSRNLTHNEKYDGQDIRTVDTDINEQRTKKVDYSGNHVYEDNTVKDKTTFNGGQNVEELGSASNTRSGGQSTTKSGNEITVSDAGNMYEHGLTVSSTTPEGFLKTDTITSDTWASGADKYRKRTEQEKESVTKKEYNGLKDTTQYDNVTDVTSFNDRMTRTTYQPDTFNEHESQRKGESGDTNKETSSDLHTGKNEVTDDTVHDTIRKITENAQSTLDKVEKIYATFVKQGDKDFLNKEEGFRGQTMSSMLKEYLEAMKNVDEMVLAELSELFIGFVL